MNFQTLNQIIIKFYYQESLWLNHFIKIGERSIFLKNFSEIDINTVGMYLLRMVPLVTSKS